MTRLYHLDAVRSFCLLFGFLVHASTIDASGTTRIFAEASGFFRLATFFIVSGYFGGMLIGRLGTSEFISRRAINLLVPFAAGVVLLNPATIYLVQLYHHGPGPSVWHLHLWFLLSLFVYVLLTRLICSALTARWVGTVFNLIPQWLILPTLAIAVGLSVVALRGGYDIALEPLIPTEVSWLVRITFNYLPFYVAGVAAFLHEPIYRSLHQFSLLAIGLAGLAFAAVLTLGLDGNGGLADKAAFHFAKNMVCLVVASLLLTLAVRFFSKPNRLVSYIGERIYTGYIFHYLAIYLLAVILQPLGLPTLAQFILVVLGTVIIVFPLHRVITAWRVTRLLFTGRLSHRPPVASPTPSLR